MYDLFARIIEIVVSLGYPGIFIMTFIEGTFVPIPSELTLIPAGYLVSKGEFAFWRVFFVASVGTFAGALFCYYIARFIGRKLLLKYGRYLWIDDKKLLRIEDFFKKHGSISVFIGRMLPAIKHVISFPAGLGRMSIKIFSIYSAAGSFIWVFIVVKLGYLIGDNEAMIGRYMKKLNIFLIVAIVAVIIAYALSRFLRKRIKQNKLK